MSVTVGLVVESTVTAIIPVVLAAYSSVVDVEVIRVVLSSRTSKLLLSVDKIPKSDATVTLKYCPVKAVVSVVEESVVALRKPESSYSVTFIMLPFSALVLESTNRKSAISTPLSSLKVTLISNFAL